jgi:hypothetical protein
MKNLSMIDMNTLNAISGSLRHEGYGHFAETLRIIQCKTETMLDSIDLIVDMVFDLLNEFDINDLKDIQYIDLAHIWCELVEKYAPDDNLIKEKLKEKLTRNDELDSL